LSAYLWINDSSCPLLALESAARKRGTQLLQYAAQESTQVDSVHCAGCRVSWFAQHLLASCPASAPGIQRHIRATSHISARCLGHTRATRTHFARFGCNTSGDLCRQLDKVRGTAASCHKQDFGMQGTQRGFAQNVQTVLAATQTQDMRTCGSQPWRVLLRRSSRQRVWRALRAARNAHARMVADRYVELADARDHAPALIQPEAL
jgi:hypothetical protein